MASKVKVIDKGWDKIKKDMSKYHKGLAASVGIQGSEASEDNEGMTNVELGAIHEFGTEDGTIPERSHFRKVFDENQAKYSKEIEKAARDFFNSEALFKGEIFLLGEQYKGDVVLAIKEGLEPGLSETGPRAGKTPLWRHGYYVNSITSAVLDGGKWPERGGSLE